jgi:uncharacterized protein YbaR (Trm112 family)
MYPDKILEKALGLLECPGCRQSPLAIANEGAASDVAVRCGDCGRSFPYRDGILDMLGETEQRLTPAQKTMQDGMVVQGYAWIRDPLTLLSGGYTFRREVQQLESALDLGPGDTVLDVACGTATSRRPSPGE